MSQLPTPTALLPCSESEMRQVPDPSETLTVPVGEAVPLEGVTDTETSSVVPCEPDDCWTPVIAVDVGT
jgi:hypothetical protein